MKRRRKTAFDLYLDERLKDPAFEKAYRLELAHIAKIQVRLRTARFVARSKWSKGEMRDQAMALRDRLQAEVDLLEAQFIHKHE